MPVNEPVWLAQFLSLVAEACQINAPVMVGYRVYPDEDGDWWVSVYPPPLENTKGEVLYPMMECDVSEILDVLDADPPFTVHCSPESTHVGGQYEGSAVYLDILWAPPEDVNLYGLLHPDGSVTPYDVQPMTALERIVEDEAEEAD